MSHKDPDLPYGLYERLITTGLKDRLLPFDRANARVVMGALDQAEAPASLARHVGEAVARTLHDFSEETRTAKQSELVNDIIQLLADYLGDKDLLDEAVVDPIEELLAIQAPTGLPNEHRDVVAPLVGLSASDLLVNARGEPGLAHALANEIPSADSIDLLCAFVRWHGLRLLEEQLTAHCTAGRYA